MTTMVVVCAAAGLVAGGGLWWWLRSGGYRRVDDEVRLKLRQVWLVVPGAVLAGAVAGVLADVWLAVAAWMYLMGGVALTWIDLDVHRVPDPVLVRWVPAVTAAVLTAAAAGGRWGLLGSAVVGAAAMGLLFLGLALLGSMGLGDVKLAVVTGMVVGTLGLTAVITAIAVSFAVAAAAGVAMLVRGADRRTHLAFGPAIVVGAAVAILVRGSAA